MNKSAAHQKKKNGSTTFAVSKNVYHVILIVITFIFSHLLFSSSMDGYCVCDACTCVYDEKKNTFLRRNNELLEVNLNDMIPKRVSNVKFLCKTVHIHAHTVI